MSIAGGLYKSCERGKDVGCNAIQIFTKNERQWKAKELTDADVDAFQKSMKECGIQVAVAHDTYLHNLATADEALRKKSIDAFSTELERCHRLGLAGLVSHPGSPRDAGEKIGLKNMVRSLNDVMKKTKGNPVRVVLETTAGQGATLGWKFEQLKEIRDGLKSPERLGFCVDTCHIFAAGYDIRTKKGWDKVFDEFDRLLGIDSIVAFHVNDSKQELGCRVDRHENLGRGHIGLEAFKCLMRDKRFREIPKILETPKEGNMDATNMGLLRSFLT